MREGNVRHCAGRHRIIMVRKKGLASLRSPQSRVVSIVTTQLRKGRPDGPLRLTRVQNVV